MAHRATGHPATGAGRARGSTLGGGEGRDGEQRGADGNGEGSQIAMHIDSLVFAHGGIAMVTRETPADRPC